MLTYKKIDLRIKNYEEEFQFWYNLLLKYDDPELSSFFNDNGYDKVKIEFFCFVSSSYIDLLCAYRNLKRSKTQWEKNYNIKFAYLISYETINTYYKYKGQVFKLVKEEEKEFYENFFDMLNRELKDFKKKYDYDNVMSTIRNGSAHYDREFTNYYTIYKSLNNKESKEIIRDFLYFINPLHYFTFSWLKGEEDEFLFVNSWMT